MTDKTYKVRGVEYLTILASESGEGYPAALYLQKPGVAPFPILLDEANGLIQAIERAWFELAAIENRKRQEEATND